MPDVDIPCRPDYDTVSQLYYFPAFCLSSIVQLVLKEWCGGTTRVTVNMSLSLFIIQSIACIIAITSTLLLSGFLKNRSIIFTRCV